MPGAKAVTGKRSRAFLTSLLLAALAALALAALASAKDLYLYEFDKSFNGADSNVGAMSTKVLKVAVNNQNGHLYVLDQHNGKADITQFDENGQAALWSGLGGTNTIELPSSLDPRDDLIFDNTSGEDWGIFVLGRFEGGAGRAYRADGTVRIPAFIKSFGGTCGLGMSRDGGLYVGGGQFASRFNPENGALIESDFTKGSPWAEGAPCHNVWDQDNNSWLSGTHESFCGCDADRGLQKYGGPTEIFFKFPDFAKPNIVVQPGDAGAVIKPVHGADIDESNDNLFTIEDGLETEGPAQVLQVTDAAQPLLNFGAGKIHQSTGIAVNGNNHRVYVTSQSPTPHIDIFKRNPTPLTVPDATTLPAGHPDGTSATLRAEIDPDGGGGTTDCRFDWGPLTNYGFGSLPCTVGGAETDAISSQAEVTTDVASLTLGDQYHYRVATRNGNGHWSFGADRMFEASTPPTTTPVLIDKINTDSGRFAATLDPNGGTTKWRFEIGTQDCSLGGCETINSGTVKSRLAPEQVQATARELDPGTLYYVRLVAENGAGELEPALEFRTYPAPPTSDPCGNRAVRQQTGAALLLDCRAYELVSAANAGTYDVESDLVPLQTPFTASPNATDRALYGLHYGSIPNIPGDPPNFGLDPYVAERTPSGWVTRYVGLPAEGMADPEASGSPLLSSDQALRSFAFGGAGICDPCFAAEGTNIPVRLDGAPAIPGMDGAYSGPSEPEGSVLKYLSADGTHLLFGSEHAFAAGGVEGQLGLYSRDLRGTGGTELVSTDAAGAPLGGADPAGIDQSTDGSRVVVGEPVGDDGAGHPLYDLYLHRAGSQASTELTPAAVAGPEEGVVYDGMTADGSRVFFTTGDRLLAADTDESADVYEALVDQDGNSSLRLISVESDGEPSNDDSCTPPGYPDTWNSAVGDGKCGALAFAYGAGVASDTGSFYFVSPEQLEGGEGEPGQANLYVVAPDADPRFVATIDSSAAKPEPPPAHPLEDSSFATVADVEALSADGSNGDVYAVDAAGGKVVRLDSSGGAADFTAGPGSGSNAIGGFSFERPAGNAVAVDNSSSGADPFKGWFYVTSKSGEHAGVSVWKPNGEKAGQLTGSDTSVGSFANACGVAVDPSDGSLYVGDKGGYIWRYQPTGSAPVTDADYAVTGVKTTTQAACAVAVQGHSVLAATFEEGAVKRYAKASFAATPLNQGGTEVTEKGRALAVDAETDELFVDEGNELIVFDGTGAKIGTVPNEGAWTGSRGLAIDPVDHHLFVSAVASGTIVEYGWEPSEYTPIDNPGIVDALNQPATHSFRDFQVSPDGRYAAFNSSLPLTGYSNNGHLEIYRYDTAGPGTLECASCAPTLAPAKNDTTLASFGLNLTDKGQVFFTSREGLVLSDTNEKLDAYQWNGGLTVGIISTGRSSYDSKLYSVSADGVDAFFFTRDVLVSADENGGAVKLYDARKEGGYLQSSAKLPCAASDECHGPGTPQPPPPDINSITGAGNQQASQGGKAKCKKGSVRKHKKCVKKRKKKRHSKRHHRQDRTESNG